MIQHCVLQFVVLLCLISQYFAVWHQLVQVYSLSLPLFTTQVNPIQIICRKSSTVDPSQVPAVAAVKMSLIFYQVRLVPLAFYKFPVSMFYYLISLSRHALLPTGLGRAIIAVSAVHPSANLAETCWGCFWCQQCSRKWWLCTRMAAKQSLSWREVGWISWRVTMVTQCQLQASLDYFISVLQTLTALSALRVMRGSRDTLEFPLCCLKFIRSKCWPVF